MRWQEDSRSRGLDHLPVALAVVVACGAALATSAVADIIRFTPALLVEQIFTDNVGGSATDRDADGITSLGARLTADVRSTRVEASMIATGYYNEYWATNELDNANGDGVAGGRLTLFTDRLVIEGQAARQEVFLTPESISGASLAPGGSQTKQTSYSVGPLLTLDMFDLADLTVRATYSQILFDSVQTAPLLPPITDVTAKHLSGRIATGERSSSYELIGTAEHLETDTGFLLRNAVGHLILHLTESIDAIARYGYEHIEDASFPTIRGPRWAVGGRYEFSQNSSIHVEYGRRFNSVNWLGEVEVQVAPRLAVAGQYADTLAPAQLSLLRPIDDLFDDAGNLDLGSAPNRIIPDPALIDQTVRDKVFSLTVTYTRDLATYSFVGRHADRLVPTLGTNDKIYAFDFEWSEILSRSLTARASVGFFDNYDPALGSEAVQQYRTQLGFVYLLTPDATLTGAYYWSVNVRELSADSQENVVRVGLQQAF